MSTLEDKLKRLSMENAAYRPQEPTEAPARAAVCLREVTEVPLEEASDGLLGSVTADTVRLISRGGDFEDWDIARAAFVDTETTGLAGGSGTVAFLIGIGYVRGDRFVVEQYFMEDYDVEHDMLERIHHQLAGFDYLVSFNGKTFDVPLLASRAVLNRIRAPLDDMEQVDLLHAARRIYRRRLKKCDLQNLEREVLGRQREGDIPGALVPMMFFDYLKTGDFAPMRLVLEHNRVDIVSLLTLLCHLCHAVADPAGLNYTEDQHSCARLQQSMGLLAQAEHSYQLAARGSDAPLRDLSLLYKRQGRHEEAAQLWETMRSTGSFGLFPCEELAKHHEHRTGRLDMALQAVDQCLDLAAGLGLRPDDGQISALMRRRARLARKMDINAGNGGSV